MQLTDLTARTSMHLTQALMEKTFQKLFPDGPPTPEEFIKKIAKVARERMEEKQKTSPKRPLS